MNLIRLFPIFLIFFLFTNCKNDKFDIDVSNINQEIKVKRFENDLMKINSDNLDNDILNLEKEYGNFFQLFNSKIINIGGTNQKSYSEYIQKFISDEVINEIYNEVSKKYNDFSKYEKELTESFKRVKYYFPERNIPNFYSYISGFNQSIVVTDEFIGIGLDKYLGSQSNFYKQLSVPIYLRFKMNESRIVPDCIYAWCTSNFEYNDKNDNVLNRMIYYGKIMYLIDALMPNYNDSLKISYNSNQIKWSQANEKNMWTYIVENKILLSSDMLTIKKLFDEAPYTSFFPKNSPPKAGIWIGWQIVRSYMENNNVSLQELMNNDNYQEILNSSGYSP